MKKNLLELTAEEALLDAVMKKYHFEQGDRESLFGVGQAVSEAVLGKAGFWCAPYGVQDGERDASDMLIAALTLGEDVDALQDRYAQEGRLLECYMAEAVAGELLLEAYRQFNAWVEAQGQLHVARYLFFGAQDCHPLEEMPKALKRLDGAEVFCNEACCLTPKKSVLFLASLTADGSVRCAGICADCGRKDCPNRSTPEEKEIWLRWPDLSGRALPYGYARILGK